MIGIAMRAAVYAALFIALVLVLLPGWILRISGGDLSAPTTSTWLIGLPVFVAGAALALWSVASDVVLGRGTPAVFDPPRQLMVGGPYAWVRNPMYIGAGLALAGAAIVYGSRALALIALGYAVVAHLFVRFYEEPQLAQRFGADYDRYRQAVHRWRPRRPNPELRRPQSAVRSSESDSAVRSRQSTPELR